ncbi:MAG: leucyl aminopeptidase, partial [Betaproteobacteria bacterium]|nr:leucyl aminopeptidase [Betaproteobacteria bacterium]
QGGGLLGAVERAVLVDVEGRHLGVPLDQAAHRRRPARLAAVLATMSTLKALGCKNQVTAYLMCTDNLPSGSAMAIR